ncbi:MAG TPA: class I SAM-dependent methyltransferase [Gemmatimonadaceae bacterium]
MRRAALYLRALPLFRRVLAGIDAAWTGLWLGALGRDDLAAVDASFYSEWDRYRSEEHNTRGLFAWEQEALRAFFPPAGRLLVTGAGGGREVHALASRGFDVDGYECNPALVERATSLLGRDGGRGTVRLLPPDRAPASGGPYDGAIAGWSSYMLVPGRARRIAFLREMRPLLRVGAPLLLSFFTRRADSPRHRIVAAVGRGVRRLRRDEPVEIGDDLFPGYSHAFTEEEILAEASAAGYRLTRFEPQGPGEFDSGWAVVHVAPAPRTA